MISKKRGYQFFVVKGRLPKKIPFPQTNLSGYMQNMYITVTFIVLRY